MVFAVSRTYSFRGRTIKILYDIPVTRDEVREELRRSFPGSISRESIDRAGKIVLRRRIREANRRYFAAITWFLSRVHGDTVREIRVTRFSEYGFPRKENFRDAKRIRIGNREYLMKGEIRRYITYGVLAFWDGESDLVLVFEVDNGYILSSGIPTTG